MLFDAAQLSIESLKARPLRTILTTLGIVIAVATIVALLTITQGLENSVSKEFESLGSDKIFVSPKGFQGPQNPISGLTTDDLKAVQNLPGFKFVTEYYVSTEEVEFKNEKLNMQVWGSQTDRFRERMESYGYKLHEGRYFGDSDKLSVILGYNIAHTKFSSEIRVKDRILIAGKKLTVVGVYEQRGTDDDNAISLPIDTMRDITGNSKDVTMIELKVSDVSSIDQYRDSINRTLARSRGNENFDVITPDQIIAQFNTVLDIIRIVLIGIGSISLLVAGIGISNAMFTSVLERTNEIGVMKSIGAENKFILVEFLIESLLLGLTGGIAGTLVGYGLASFVGSFSKGVGGLPLLIEPNYGLFVFGMGFALITAVMSGILPAKHASEMKPVDALRAD